MAIQGFADKALEKLHRTGKAPKGVPADLVKRLTNRLDMMNAAHVLDDLRTPPSMRLEALKGDRKGQHSVRVNDQFRICFVWTAAGPDALELVDYH
ncbi:type II toxin-antitoxin system RelE/ParE family toxin [Euryhalocaulis caribicus]|uniref:type II toxin-antitoxin system RelE/ParE family toxin n=1 Tax=Euryhalocaulis caribicus TaxID=1161401 RepID=UPI00039BC798|nr:type II toxin-antitoxin system RelE/ParE family toxin [Euryhalocaulis caribicus]